MELGPSKKPLSARTNSTPVVDASASWLHSGNTDVRFQNIEGGIFFGDVQINVGDSPSSSNVEAPTTESFFDVASSMISGAFTKCSSFAKSLFDYSKNPANDEKIPSNKVAIRRSRENEKATEVDEVESESDNATCSDVPAPTELNDRAKKSAASSSSSPTVSCPGGAIPANTADACKRQSSHVENRAVAHKNFARDSDSNRFSELRGVVKPVWLDVDLELVAVVEAMKKQMFWSDLCSSNAMPSSDAPAIAVVAILRAYFSHLAAMTCILSPVVATGAYLRNMLRLEQLRNAGLRRLCGIMRVGADDASASDRYAAFCYDFGLTLTIFEPARWCAHPNSDRSETRCRNSCVDEFLAALKDIVFGAESSHSINVEISNNIADHDAVDSFFAASNKLVSILSNGAFCGVLSREGCRVEGQEVTSVASHDVVFAHLSQRLLPRPGGRFVSMSPFVEDTTKDRKK